MITSKYLKSILNYDKNTGVFTWNIYRSYNAKIGDIAGGYSTPGYRQISINSKHYLAHRLAWLYVYGEMPKDQIDHINGIRDDNRIENLREVTNQENHMNRKKMTRNKTGFTGVYWHKKSNKWQSDITVDGDKIYLGSYTEKEDAIKARTAANQKYGFHANHGN